MLISFLALVGLLNGILTGIHNVIGVHSVGGHNVSFPSTLNSILGFFCAPVAWMIGIPWHDAPTVGNLIGTRAVLNEFIAYTELGKLANAHAIYHAHAGHRNVCAVRLCQPGLGGHADRRHRRTDSAAPQRAGESSACAHCWQAPWPT